MRLNVCLGFPTMTATKSTKLWTLTKALFQREAQLIKAISLSSRNVPERHLITLTARKKFIPKYAKDGVPKDFSLVFENSLNKILGPCRIATTGVGILTILSSFGCLVYYWPSLSAFDTVGLSTAVIVSLPTVVLVNVLSRRYFLRIYYKESKNTFIGVNQNFMGSLSKFEYSPRDISVVSSFKRDMQYDKSNIKIFGNSFHLKANDFILPKYYNMHTGHVK